MTIDDRPERQRFVVGVGKLVPAELEGRAQLDHMNVGEVVEVVIYRERNPTFARLVYKTFNLIGDAMQWRARNVRGWIAVKTGRADLVAWPPTGVHKVVTVPHGTGAYDMNQLELEAFWDDAREVIREQVIPYVDPPAGEQIGYRLDNLLSGRDVS